MGKLTASVLLATAIMTTPVWIPTASIVSAQAHSDHIVQMRQDIAAARKEYKRKLGEAQKVFDEQKSAAAKERDATISAARAAAAQK